jgi:hypothetical protein
MLLLLSFEEDFLNLALVNPGSDSLQKQECDLGSIDSVPLVLHVHCLNFSATESENKVVEAVEDCERRCESSEAVKF